MGFFPPFHWGPLPAGNQSFLFLHKNMSVFLHLFLSSKWEVNLSSPKRNVSLVRCCVMCGFFEVGTGGQGVVKGQTSGAKSKKTRQAYVQKCRFMMIHVLFWLVVWNIYFPYIGNSNPNWLIFLRGVGQPPTSILLWIWGAKNGFASLAKHVRNLRRIVPHQEYNQFQFHSECHQRPLFEMAMGAGIWDLG